LAFLVGSVLAARALLLAQSGELPRPRLSEIEWSIVAMALASSALPLLWMSLRQVEITKDDVLYALVLWKFAAVYLIVRVSVRTVSQVRRCLYLSVATAAVVAVVAVLQALDLLNVRGVLATYYVPHGHVGALAKPRGGSTLALPAAVADLMVWNIAIVVGLLVTGARHRRLLSVAAVVFVLAAVSAGEFSSVLGLAVGAVVTAVVLRRPAMLLLSVPLGALAALVLWPVIMARLRGFQGATGLPESWAGRLHNLEGYFWPYLFSDNGFVLGVRPSARVAVPSQATGYVWIESGYTWLLWAGGLPLLLAFAWFTRAAARHAVRVATWQADAVGVAATALLAGVVVTALLMLFDPHLTYRGSGDVLFMLAALAQVRPQRQPVGEQPRETAGVAA